MNLENFEVFPSSSSSHGAQMRRIRDCSLPREYFMIMAPFFEKESQMNDLSMLFRKLLMVSRKNVPLYTVLAFSLICCVSMTFSLSQTTCMSSSLTFL